MIEIKVPKEISEYKQKFLFGLTVRQFVSVVLALGICVPLYIFGRKSIGEDVISWLVIIIAVPIFCFGFLKFNDMSFERFLLTVIRQLLEPQKRTYVDLPVFWYLRQEMIEEEILHQTELKKRKERDTNGKRKRT